VIVVRAGSSVYWTLYKEYSYDGREGVKLCREIPCKVLEVKRRPVERDLMKVERV
jgi:hypothetical protein